MDDAARQRLEVETRYDPAAVEPAMFARWQEAGGFDVEPGDPGEPFVIAVPPPNVTGSLHMGHALNGSMQDVTIRLKRMQGRKALWILGTDHAGIATQNVVERMLGRMNLTREELGREEFVRRVWNWREESGATIIDQFKQLGCSLDYEHERFTMDDEYARAVVVVFVELHERGYLYRANRMVNWCTVCATAISDLEVDHVEADDTLYSVDYPLVGGGHVTVATVRPVTLLGDTAVAVNPADERYRHLIGQRAIVPLAGREVPIVGDEHVDVDVGTGALKVTPGHDPNDLEIGRRHGLEEIAVIGFDGRMTAAAGERYAGLPSEEAQKLVIADLREAGLLRDEQPWRHSVGHCSRSGNRVEPLVSLQWFCEMQELAAPAIAAVREGRVRFVPKSRERIFFDWMEQIRPWCVSRQLWWGHQLPVWYCSCGETIVQAEPPTHCPSCDSSELERDADVLDTWFSSALWPFATLGWPDDTARLRAFYPGHALFTARDIINLWVARMLMMGIAFTPGHEQPFSDVVIHPTVLAPDGRRMSKSLGTGVDPLDLIAKHGADATRYGLLKMSSTQDVRFSEGAIEEGRGLCNKLWNAARLILLNVDGDAEAGPSRAEPVDAWVLGQLADATAEVTGALEEYDFAAAVKALYRFVWNDVCDWYLEAAKARLYGDDATARREVSETLLHVLRETLRLAHPVLPHVTERIWGELGEDGVLARASWSLAGGAERDAESERAVEQAFEFIGALRQLRAVAKLAPRAPLVLQNWPLASVSGLVEALGGVTTAPADKSAESRAVDVIAVDGVPVTVLAPGGAENLRSRFEQELAKAEGEIERARKKLADARFVERAPAHLVEAERDKAERFEREAAELRARLAALGA
jgi:valyl-tRNA synthetase